jgi:uridine kinase
MRSHIIGIAGPSCSGKTELARRLSGELPGAAIISLDSYYLGMEEIPLEERKRVNFDHPDSLDSALLHEHLAATADGRPFDEPVYSFADYPRTAATRRIEPSPHLIVEGLFVLYWPQLRALLDTKVFVDTAAAVCLDRRLERDVAERGRTRASVIEQYERTVRPSAERFVYPTREYADLVVSGEEPPERSTAAVLAALRTAELAAPPAAALTAPIPRPSPAQAAAAAGGRS